MKAFPCSYERDFFVYSGHYKISDRNPESKLGMNLSWVSLPIVVHLIGPTYAKKMVILGKNNHVETLLKRGFISEVLPKEQLLDRAVEIAKEYAYQPLIATQMIKRSVNHISSAIILDDYAEVNIDLYLGCGLCTSVCTEEAITLEPRTDRVEHFNRVHEMDMAIIKGKRKNSSEIDN